MSFNMNKFLAVGTKVKVAEPMDVPDWSKWDDDKGRTSGSVKKRLQSQFFQGNRNIVGEIIYISRESEREKLRKQGRVKVRIRDQAGTNLTITADPGRLSRTH